MINISKFEDVKSNIISGFKRKMIIPVLGSGLTRNCPSRRGIVPSGDDYKSDMIKMLEKQSGIGASEIEELKKQKFSVVSSVYHSLIPVNEQQRYLQDHFKGVKIEEYKTDFLAIDWPYIYSLNIDDAIESNSRYSTVIYSNRRVRNNIFAQNKCVIKLHGDINDILSYEDSDCEIFDQSQYVVSIKKNEYLLSKLTHDFEYINLLFIGCSLSDEIDILYSSVSSVVNKNARYYCTTKEPTFIERTILEKYGITDCLIFDSYEDIYTEFVNAYKEAGMIEATEIDNFKAYKFSVNPSGFDVNKPYMFYGKNLINRDKTITLPNFFIDREITDEIIKNIDRKSIQLLIGSGCSGKTYIAISIVRRIRDRDVYLFESVERINEEALQKLLGFERCVIIADSKALSIKQIELILRSKKDLERKGVAFIIIEDKNNRDLSGLLSLLAFTEGIKKEDIPQFEIKNKFTKNEIQRINPFLVVSGIQVFSDSKSLADNIINASNDCIDKHRFLEIRPQISTIREVASLILLATRKKVYSRDGVELDIISELLNQTKKASPLIEDESTWSFERDAVDNSPIKFVINAEYWLNNQLFNLSNSMQGRRRIIDAYKYIVTRYIQVYEKPDLLIRNNNAKYKDIIMFDAIIQIFGFKGLKLIREIYEALGELLSTDPNFVHQRAKCYIRSSRYEGNKEKKKEYVINAYRDAGVARSAFKMRYDTYKNEKIGISMAHTRYTEALAICHLVTLEEYSNIEHNSLAIDVLYDALSSPYNSIEYVERDVDNYGNVLKKTANTLFLHPEYVNEQIQHILPEVFKVFFGS